MSIGYSKLAETWDNSAVEDKGRLAAWMEKKYLDWQRANGRAAIKVFAKPLGVTGAYIVQIMNGTRTNVSKKTANRFANVLADYEILDILGYARPEPADQLSVLPPEIRSPIVTALKEAEAELLRKGIANRSPEGNKIINDAFTRHGVSIKIVEVD